MNKKPQGGQYLRNGGQHLRNIQFVGQEFEASNRRQLYYWARDAKNSNAEIDFLEVRDGRFIPVEVKDGPSGRLRSLHIFRDQYQPPYSVVFHSGPTGILKDDLIIFLPLYFAGSFTQFELDLGKISNQ